MSHWVLRQLILKPWKSLLIVFAIGAVFATILVLSGFEQGLYIQSKDMVMKRNADLLVSQAGVSNFIAARSSLRQLTRREVEAVKGVKIAHPITEMFFIYNSNGLKTPVGMIVYESWGGPTNIIEGRGVENSGEIVIDRSLAKKYALKPGDDLVISDYAFKISGITEGASALFSPFAFVNYDGMIDFFLEAEVIPDISTFPLLSYLLIELEDGANTTEVMSDIERKIPDVDVRLPSTVAAKDVKMSRDMFGPVMKLLIGISGFICLLIVGLIIYSDIRSKKNVFGILKALGFSNPALIKGVVYQILMLSLISIPVGIALAALIAETIEWIAPVYLVPIMLPGMLFRSILFGLLFALIGGSIPLRMVMKADPVEAFRGT